MPRNTCNECTSIAHCEAHAPAIPEGLVRTDRETFFATCGQLNVHPYPKGTYPYYSEWRMLPYEGKLMGWTYLNQYAIHPELVRAHMLANPKE